MNFLRLILHTLVIALIVGALLVVVAFAPVVQTWIAQGALARQPGLKGTLGSFWAGFGRVSVDQLQLTMDGAVLTVPSLKAELPLATALWNRRFRVRRLEAKGWTLDLRKTPVRARGEPAEPAPPVAAQETPATAAQETPTASETVTAQNAVRILRGALSQLRLPCDGSLDGVDLDGELLIAAPVGGEAVRIHVIVKGGGMAAGREGAFTFDASGDFIDAEGSMIALVGRGRVAAAMDSPRTFSRVEAKVDLSAKGGILPEDITLTAGLVADLGAGGQTVSLEAHRGDHSLADVRTRILSKDDRLAGTWKLDVQDSDIAPFVPKRSLPHFLAEGDGPFDCDATFGEIHAAGRLNGTVSSLGVLAPALERFGEVAVDGTFEATRRGPSIRVDRMGASLGGTGPALVVQSLQPFDIDARTGVPKPLDPAGDWLDVSLRGFPLAWLFAPSDGFALSGGDASGAFVVRAARDGFALRSKGPVTAAGVSVRRAGRNVAPKVDLALSLLGEYGSTGWQLQAAPLLVDREGRRLAALEAKASRPAAPDQPVAISGTWSADLPTLMAGVSAPGFSWIRGKSAAGDFTVKLGAATEFDGKVSVGGHDESHTITAGVHGEADDSGRLSFLAPITVTLGSAVTGLSVEGTSIREEAGNRLYLKLTGKDVELEHLRLLATALAEAQGAPVAAGAGAQASTRVPDRIPFWGDWTGNITMAFNRLRAGEVVLEDAGGALVVSPRSIRLESGQGAIAGRHFTKVEGSLGFDASAGIPYNLKATGMLDQVDSASIFPATKDGPEPPFGGLFSIATTLNSQGVDLVDLIGKAQEEFRLTSQSAIVRVFKTDVDEAMPPEKISSVGDTLGRMGSGVGTFFGVEDTGQLGKKTVRPAVEAVLNLINDVAEIGFDDVAITAVRGTDRTIHLVDLAMTAKGERLTGTGQIGYVNGLPLRAQPFSADLQFWGHGRIARRLAAAGLLSTEKDDRGYTKLNQPIHLGGTLEHIDKSQWHDLLVKAAERDAAPAKKSP